MSAAELADQFLATADDLAENGELQKAIQQYDLASEHYLIAAQTSNAEEAKFWKLRSANCRQAADELKRRLYQNKQTSSPALKAAVGPRQMQVSNPSISKPVETVPPSIKRGSIASEPPKLAEDDHADAPFTNFWDAIEALVQRLPNVSLGKASRGSQAIPFEAADDDVSPNHSVFESYMVVHGPNSERPLKQSALQQADKSENQTIQTLQAENERLRHRIEALERAGVTDYEAAELARENALLKSNIMQFRNDFANQARKFKMTESLRQSTPLVNRDLNASDSTSVAIKQLEDKVRQLEADNKKLRDDNAILSSKLKAYREKWAQLKAYAKKSKDEHSVTASDPNSSINSPQSSVFYSLQS